MLAHAEPRSHGNPRLGALSALGARSCPSVDAALECCEDALLARAGDQLCEPSPVLAVQELLEGLSDAEIAAIDELVELELVNAGDLVVREGDDGDSVFFLLSGTVDVQVQLDGGRTHRLSTVGPGVAFGELAMLDRSRRSADVVATDDSMLARVAVDDLCGLGDRHPQMMATIYRNLAANLARRLRAANEQVRALDQ